MVNNGYVNYGIYTKCHKTVIKIKFLSTGVKAQP